MFASVTEEWSLIIQIMAKLTNFIEIQNILKESDIKENLYQIMFCLLALAEARSRRHSYPYPKPLPYKQYKPHAKPRCHIKPASNFPFYRFNFTRNPDIF